MSRCRNYGFWLSAVAFIVGAIRYTGVDLGIAEDSVIADLIIGVLVALGIINNPVTESKWYKDDDKS